MRIVSRCLVVAIAIMVGVAAHAQTWPTKPVKMINAFAAGSAPDIVNRVMADRLSRAFNQQFVVENRPGGTGVIAAQAVARAPADGYTYFFATTAPLITNRLTFKTLPYDPEKDFAPVAMIGRNPFIILVSPDLPVKSLPQLVAYERQHAGQLSFATDGPRNFSGMVGAWLNRVAGTDFVQVPYANIGQGIQDTIAGRTQGIILAFAAARPFMTSGKLKAIAKTGPDKVPGFEPMPQVADTYPGFLFAGWFAVVAATGTPSDAILRMNRELSNVLQDPEVVQKLDEIGVSPGGAETPEAFGRFMRGEDDRWEKIVREIGLEPE
jgi:tripartite-type tricarboxylate transporter receptor subunit TctC